MLKLIGSLHLWIDINSQMNIKNEFCEGSQTNLRRQIIFKHFVQ